MIPKVIHYIWLGGNPLPPMVVKCIKSWKKHCPDYEIKRWDESNLNLDINIYCRQAYNAKKYAFASDVLRFYVLKEYGGVYLDVDVLMMRPLDDLLNCNAFLGLEDYSDLSVNPGLIMGSVANGKVATEMLNQYEGEVFVKEDGEINYETICSRTTKYLTENIGLKLENCKQEFVDIIVYPTQYFCPLKGLTKENLYETDYTYTKHLYLASWVPKQKFSVRVKNKIKQLLIKILGRERVCKIRDKIKKGKDG